VGNLKRDSNLEYQILIFDLLFMTLTRFGLMHVILSLICDGQMPKSGVPSISETEASSERCCVGSAPVLHLMGVYVMRSVWFVPF